MGRNYSASKFCDYGEHVHASPGQDLVQGGRETAWK